MLLLADDRPLGWPSPKELPQQTDTGEQENAEQAEEHDPQNPGDRMEEKVVHQPPLDMNLGCLLRSGSRSGINTRLLIIRPRHAVVL